MNKSITFGQYRAVDLTIMTVLTVVAEAIVSLAASKWFPYELYSLSPMVAMVCIVMMRWGVWAVIPTVLSGAAFCLVIGATPEQFVIYCAGNCGALIALILFKAVGKEKVRAKALMTAVFALTAFAGTICGRWAVALLLGWEINSIISFFLADCLSLVFAVGVTQLARRIDGLFEDQKAYLIRTDEERQKERKTESDYYD